LTVFATLNGSVAPAAFRVASILISAMPATLHIPYDEALDLARAFCAADPSSPLLTV